MESYYICDNFRTPYGSIGGFLSRLSPEVVANFMVFHLLEDNDKLDPEMISNLLLGTTLDSNFGPDFATQVVRASKLVDSVDRAVLNSGHITGLKLVDFATKSLNGAPGVVAAMGLENISSVPNYVPNGLVKSRNESVQDMTPLNGVLRDAYYVDKIKNFTGQLAEQLCISHKLRREDLDQYTLDSVARTGEAITAGKMAGEIKELNFNIEDGSNFTFNEDQEYGRYLKTDDISVLNPAFTTDGRLTIATSARSADGASMALIANEAGVKEHGLTPVARVAAYAEVYGDPEKYVESGAKSTKAAAKKAGITLSDIDLFEIHEDFASTPLIYTQKLKMSESQVNKQGGSLGVGNPIGSTGMRLVNSLCNQFGQNGAKYGVATVCGPSGGSASLVLERL